VRTVVGGSSAIEPAGRRMSFRQDELVRLSELATSKRPSPASRYYQYILA
jgi:hypothetical protein